MKTRLHIFFQPALMAFLYIASAWSNTVINLQPTSNGYLLNCTIHNWDIKSVDQNGFSVESGYTGETYTSVTLPGNAFATGDIGKPQLPALKFEMAIFDKARVPTFEIAHCVEEELALTNHVYPAQKYRLKSKAPQQRPFLIDNEFYASEGAKQPLITVSDRYIIRGVPCVTVTVSPFSYNPAEKKITVAEKFSITVKTETKRKIRCLDSKQFEKLLGAVVVNFSDMVEPAYNQGLENYLIITAPEYETDLHEFINFKKNKYSVKCVTTQVTGTTASAIQTYIKNEYDNASTKPTYLLIVGDKNDVPISYEAGMPSDILYSDMNGDFRQDIFNGRFSVSSSEELKNVIAKTMYMEVNLNIIEKRVLTIGSKSAPYFVQNNYTCFEHGVTARDSIINDINNGVIVTFYKGHGSVSGWTCLLIDDLNTLSNTVYPFTFGFACNTAEFDRPPCFGEAFTRMKNGAVTYWGSSAACQWGLDDRLESGIYKALEEDVTGVSASFIAGLLSVGDRDYFRQYNLLGDPSLDMVSDVTEIGQGKSVAPFHITTSYTLNGNILSVNIHSNGPHAIKLINLQGKCIESYKGIGAQSYNTSKPIADGIYLLSVFAGNMQSVVKIAVIKK